MAATDSSTEILAPGFFAREDTAGVIPPSSPDEMDAALSVLHAYKDFWVTMSLRYKIEMLDQLLEDTRAVREAWCAAGIASKGTRGDIIGEAEEWAMFAHVMRQISLLAASLRDIRRFGRPQIPGPLSKRENGQIVAQVYPIRRFDRLFLQRTTAEVWMQPGVTARETLSGQARFYHDKSAQGRVCLVLAAGNASMSVPADFLYKLFVEGQVVIIKMNPVNDYLGPILYKAFHELISHGFLRIVYGGADEGSYLCRHPHVDEIHMTGSNKTFETILFTPGTEGAQRKAARAPALNKRFTAELGAVAPVIIVPGSWSASDIQTQAEKLVLWMILNAGFYCLTPRVLIQWAGWDQRQEFNQAVAGVLARVPPRKAYYPGAFDRHARFLDAHPQAQQHGAAADDCLPWTFICDIDAGDMDNICFRYESFCGLLAETAVAAPDIISYLEHAVQFVNETLWGNLTATLIVHPKCLKKRHIAAAVDHAVADLRTGMVLVNQAAALGYMIGSTTWGAYPGNAVYDVQSGIGITANALMFEQPQKSVVRGPFSLALDPMSLRSRTVNHTCRRLADVQYKPSLANLSGMLLSALRS